MKYKCIRKCHYAGRLFREGDIVSFEKTPPNHFEQAESGSVANVTVRTSVVDPMKPSAREAVSALSQFVSQPKAAGFASTLEPSKPAIELAVKNDKRKAGRPRKQ